MGGDELGSEAFDEPVDPARDCDAIEAAKRFLDPVGLLEMTHCWTEFAEVLERLAQSEMDAYAVIDSGEAGKNVEHALDERAVGLSDSANADQIVVGAAQLGVERDRLFQRRTRLGKAAAFGQDPAQEPETVCAAGIEFDGPPGFALGVGGLALDHQSPDQVQSSISVLAVRRRRAIRVAGRLAQAALGEQVSKSAHRFRSPPHRSGDAIGLDRLVIPALGLERESLPVVVPSEIVLKR